MNWYDISARNYDPALARWFVFDPKSDDMMQVDLTPYNYSWNNPINVSDPNGECPACWGAVFGALVDYGTQVAINFASGDNWQDALWNNIDGDQVLTSTLAGAATGGISALKTAGTVTKSVMKLTVDVTEEAVNQVNKTGTVDVDNLVKDVVQSKIIDSKVGDAKLFKNVDPSKVKTAERRLDRAERVARGPNPRASRQQAVKDAKSDIKKIDKTNNLVDKSNKVVGGIQKKVINQGATNVRSLIKNISKLKSRDIKLKDARSFEQKKDNVEVVNPRMQ